MTLEAEFAEAITAVLRPARRTPLAVAVSGGGDSLALLLLLSDWSRTSGCELHAVTVDHGLRPESAGEANWVAARCVELRVPHATLRWRDWNGKGNLQSEARSARRRLISDWAKENGISSIALGHTMDDQAETFLLRLARGSGVDGLSAMQMVSSDGGVDWVRPLLRLRRGDLRMYLRSREVSWLEDPSNQDLRFDRVRARQALELLAPVGIGTPKLSSTADNMARARSALQIMTDDVLKQSAECRATGDAVLDVDGYSQAPEEIRLRVLAALLCRVSGERYRPRFTGLLDLDSAIVSSEVGAGVTYHGCILRNAAGGRVVVRREFARVQARIPAAKGVWDGKWAVFDLEANHGGTMIGAVGPEGLRQLETWRDTGCPREVLVATPALWSGDVLVAAPLAGKAGRMSVSLT